MPVINYGFHYEQVATYRLPRRRVGKNEAAPNRRRMTLRQRPVVVNNASHVTSLGQVSPSDATLMRRHSLVGRAKTYNSGRRARRYRSRPTDPLTLRRGDR
jgi:hypothetical protein